jgi:hypothetical protein
MKHRETSLNHQHLQFSAKSSIIGVQLLSLDDGIHGEAEDAGDQIDGSYDLSCCETSGGLTNRNNIF